MSLLETKTIQLRTISPVHIQGKDIEYGQGFVRRDDQTAYAIDADKLAQYLYEKTNDLTLLNKYVDEVEEKAMRNKMKDFDFEGFLSGAGIYHHEKLKVREKDLINFGVFKSVVIAPQGNQFIQNCRNNAFIPGSSLKGVLRTAVMYDLVRKKLNSPNNNTAKDFINGINKKVSDYLTKIKSINHHQRERKKREFSRELQCHPASWQVRSRKVRHRCRRNNHGGMTHDSRSGY